MDMKTGYENTADHKAILDELKRLREDFQEVIRVTREEQMQYRRETREEFKAIREILGNVGKELHRIDKVSDKAKTLSEDNKAVVWKAAGTVIVAFILAVAGVLGWK